MAQDRQSVRAVLGGGQDSRDRTARRIRKGERLLHSGNFSRLGKVMEGEIQPGGRRVGARMVTELSGRLEVKLYLEGTQAEVDDFPHPFPEAILFLDRHTGPYLIFPSLHHLSIHRQ